MQLHIQLYTHFVIRVVFPKYRQKRSRKALWYLDTTLVRDNPAVAEELLDSQYVAHEFRGVCCTCDCHVTCLLSITHHSEYN